MMYWWWGDHMGGWGWALMLAGNLVFLALLVGGIVGLVRVSRRQSDEARPTPRDLLAARFARGEIDEAEYRRRLEVLGQTAERHPTGAP